VIAGKKPWRWLPAGADWLSGYQMVKFLPRKGFITLEHFLFATSKNGRVSSWFSHRFLDSSPRRLDREISPQGSMKRDRGTGAGFFIDETC
jgi:hypothetical protein